MFFEPMLLYPVLRRSCFSLQELARAAICDSCKYDRVSQLPLPQTLKVSWPNSSIYYLMRTLIKQRYYVHDHLTLKYASFFQAFLRDYSYKHKIRTRQLDMGCAGGGAGGEEKTALAAAASSKET